MLQQVPSYPASELSPCEGFNAWSMFYLLHLFSFPVPDTYSLSINSDLPHLLMS